MHLKAACRLRMSVSYLQHLQGGADGKKKKVELPRSGNNPRLVFNKRVLHAYDCGIARSVTQIACLLALWDLDRHKGYLTADDGHLRTREETYEWLGIYRTVIIGVASWHLGLQHIWDLVLSSERFDSFFLSSSTTHTLHIAGSFHSMGRSILWGFLSFSH